MKPWLCFLSCVLAVFDKFNVYFQTSFTATIHNLQGECERLLKTVLLFLVKPSEISRSSDLTTVDYTTPANYLSANDTYTSDETLAFQIDIGENEEELVKIFYDHALRCMKGL